MKKTRVADKFTPPSTAVVLTGLTQCVEGENEPEIDQRKHLAAAGKRRCLHAAAHHRTEEGGRYQWGELMAYTMWCAQIIALMEA